MLDLVKIVCCYCLMWWGRIGIKYIGNDSFGGVCSYIYIIIGYKY